jgi:small subunit ribosomal protein S21
MISIDLKKYKSLDQALKAYKQKHNKIGIVKELRERQEFVKPSVKKRAEKLKAKYVQKKFGPTQ